MRDPHPELVVVGTYPDEFAAKLAQTALEAAGVESMVRNYNAVGYPAALGCELLVAVDDAISAKQILSQ
jgi:hypothetical protein